jgi:hypothetical protein
VRPEVCVCLCLWSVEDVGRCVESCCLCWCVCVCVLRLCVREEEGNES